MRDAKTGKELTLPEVALHMRRVLGTLEEYHPTDTLAGRMVKAVIDQYDDLPEEDDDASTPA